MLVQLLSRLSLQTYDHFNEEIVFLRIWTTKMNSLNKDIFPISDPNNELQRPTKLYARHGMK